MSIASEIQVDLQRLAHNVGVLRRVIGRNVELCCVIKADAYGLGATRIARWMDHLPIDLLAVYTLEQAEQLCKANVGKPLLVLMPIHDVPRPGPVYRAVVSGRLHFVVHDLAHLNHLIALADSIGCRLPIHVEVDTGMSRGGANVADVREMLERVASTRAVELHGFFTHFASAEGDERATAAQLDAFNALAAEMDALIPESCRLHAASTHAVLRDPKYHLDMVRIGLAWTGFGCEALREEVHLAAGEALLPIVTWTSRLVHTKWIEPGTTVGYGRTWRARRRTRVGLVPVGYADGYPVTLSNKAVVRVQAGSQWCEAPVIGRVSMDQLTVDLTDLAVAVGVGASVELIGSDPAAGNHLPTLAAQANLQPYMLLCGLSPRISRIYRNQVLPQPQVEAPSQPAQSARPAAGA
ncbi:MAG: alanine racemase [Phycisphaerales bacterium]|nr:alanine racemase [Phycisphaerales bacterium]